MRVLLFRQAGFFGTLTAAALLILATGCAENDNPPAQNDAPVVAPIDWDAIDQKSQQLRAEQFREKLPKAEIEKKKEQMVAGTLTYADVWSQVRKGMLTDADYASIYNLGVLFNPTYNKGDSPSTLLRDRNTVEGKPEFLDGTWVSTSSPFDIMQFILVYSFGPNSTYEYVVGARNLSRELTYNEWASHKGTYKISKITGPKRGSMDEHEEPAQQYLYTITVTPDKATHTLIKDPDVKVDRAKILADYLVLNDQVETFAYKPEAALAKATMIAFENMRPALAFHRTLHLYDFKPIKLEELPRK